MNNLPREKQIEVISALCDGLGIRSTARITGVNRGTVAALALRVGCGCEELHDRMMVGLRISRCELDELWSFVQRKRRQHEKPRSDIAVTGDQYTYVALASSTRAIIGYRTGKRDSATTDDFIQDLRARVIGVPEITTDGYHPYKNAIRDAFGSRVAHGVIAKTYSVTHLAVTEASRRYIVSPQAAATLSATYLGCVSVVIATRRAMAWGHAKFSSQTAQRILDFPLRISANRQVC